MQGVALQYAVQVLATRAPLPFARLAGGSPPACADCPVWDVGCGGCDQPPALAIADPAPPTLPPLLLLLLLLLQPRPLLALVRSWVLMCLMAPLFW